MVSLLIVMASVLYLTNKGLPTANPYNPTLLTAISDGRSTLRPYESPIRLLEQLIAIRLHYQSQ
jgi:hypothetical protein